MNAESTPLQPRLTRAEYWLLETAVVSGIPFCFLPYEHYSGRMTLDAMFNKTGHGLRQAELLETLVGLVNDGLIVASADGERIWAPQRDEIAQALVTWIEYSKYRDRVCYRLTAKGAAVWEAFAAPDWELFLDESRWSDAGEMHTVHAVSKPRLQSYLEDRAALLSRTGIEISNLQIEELTPFEATYWKTLPQGFKATYHLPEPPDDAPSRDTVEWLADCQLMTIRDEWYRWR